jgi:hypothetical protein
MPASLGTRGLVPFARKALTTAIFPVEIALQNPSDLMPGLALRSCGLREWLVMSKASSKTLTISELPPSIALLKAKIPGDGSSPKMLEAIDPE